MTTQIPGVVARELTTYTDDRGWLMELFRADELDAEFLPAMTYISMTKPGVTRGPHEHKDQADYFCFIGPSMFRLYLWDNREGSETFGRRWTLDAGADLPMAVLVPKGVVHAYKNIGQVEGLVYNAPNRLYRGEGRRDEVDEIRHENDPKSRFVVED